MAGNNTNRSTLIGSIVRVALVLMLLAGFAACSGEDGAPGQDGISPDIVPPAVALLTPAAGDTASEELLVVASAVDNIAIDRVVFYLDGSDRINDSTFAEVSSSEAVDNQYTWTFNLLQLGIINGVHTVMARAFDVGRNQADTPTIIIYTEYETPAGQAVLRAWEPDSIAFYEFPQRDLELNPLDGYHSTRFLPERDCLIESVRLYLSGDALVDLNYDSTFTIRIHDSDGVNPILENTLGIGTLNVVGLDSTGWFTVDIEEAGTFPANRYFHVSVSPDTLTETSAFALGVSIREKYDYPTYSRSARYLLETGTWQSLQDQYAGDEWTAEFMIEVWVNYQ